MLNHGFTTPAEFYNMLDDLHRFKTSTEHVAQLRNEENTNRNREALRVSAHTARSKFEHGQRIFMQIQKGELSKASLSGYQNRLCESFNDNSLYHLMIAANKAYGQREPSLDDPTAQSIQNPSATRLPRKGLSAYGKYAEVRTARLRTER